MATATRMTLETFLELPETKPYREYDCGEMYRKPMPDVPHGLLQLFLGSLMLQAARFAGGIVATELRCVFGPRDGMRSYVPDILYATRDRVPAGNLADQQYLPTAPDLAVEVLSRGQPNQRFNRKIDFYLANGVRLVWIIDPRRRTVTVLAPEQGPRVLTDADTLDGGDVLPGFSIPVAEIFAQLDP